LSGISYGSRPSIDDVDLLRTNAQPEERDLELDDLARTIAQRETTARPMRGNQRQGGCRTGTLSIVVGDHCCGLMPPGHLLNLA
jgi:hypothetical protein